MGKVLTPATDDALVKQGREILDDTLNLPAQSLKQDLLAMVALEYATGYLQNDQLLSENETQWKTKLLAIDHVLDEQLKYENANVL